MTHRKPPPGALATISGPWSATSHAPRPPLSASRRRALLWAASLAAPMAARSAHASIDTARGRREARDSRELTLVVPYAAGGPLDRSARKLARETAGLGTIRVLNMTGEGGGTGAAMVARAGGRDPMLLMGAVGTHAILPQLNPQLPYDPLRDFVPLVLVGRMPHVLIMRSELAQQWRISTPGDLLRFMAKNRQPLRYASGGKGSVGHLAGKLFQSLTQVPLQHLPFGGARPALSAVLEGSADLMFDNLGSTLPHYQAGRLKAIGVTWREPVAQLPGVPSLNDSVPGMHMATWFGLFATAGIADPLAQRWTGALAQALQQPEMQQYLDAMGVLRMNLRRQEFARFVQDEHRYYGQLIQSGRLPPD